jgi:hypothetical protein
MTKGDAMPLSHSRSFLISLTLGFSQVRVATRRTSRFNGLPLRRKPLKRFPRFYSPTPG